MQFIDLKKQQLRIRNKIASEVASKIFYVAMHSYLENEDQELICESLNEVG